MDLLESITRQLAGWATFIGWRVCIGEGFHR
jgi:hypothetical protein